MIGDASIAAADSVEAPAPLMAAPVPPAGWAPGQSRPMSAEQAKRWRETLERAEAKAKEYHPQWERALKRYAEAKVGQRTDINALLDYRHVEGKKAALFHRTPDVSLTPIEPEDQELPLQDVLPVRQKFLNHELGPKGANAKRALHKTLVDTLAASGWMIVEVGYEDVKLPVPPNPDGSYAIDSTGQPVKEIAIWSRRFISQVSSMKLLVPAEFNDTDYDQAPFLAVKGVITVSAAKRARWTLPADIKGTTQADEARFKHGDSAGQDGTDPLLEYTKVWYRASLYDESVFNPELFRCLILIKGVDVPAWHVDSPFQELTPEGALTDASLVGNPIHVGTLRDLVDSAYIPSDLVIGEQLSLEENKFRTGLIQNRKARMPITLISDDLDQPTQEKIIKDRVAVVPAAVIGEGGSQRVVAVVQAGSEPRDNFQAQDVIERDYEQALGRSANQGGQFSKTKRTATEVRTVQGNSSAREETEKDRIREYFVALVRKFDTVVQRTATQQELTKVLGKQGAALWEQWRALPGKYGYDVLPDSGQYVDAREYQDHALNLYNLTRKDERIQPEELLTLLARAFHRDPAKFIAPPKDSNTEPPSASIAFKGEDVANPAMGNVLLDLLTNGGIKLRPETVQAFKEMHDLQRIQQAATGIPIGMDIGTEAHGGSADVTEPINQHQTERTGRNHGSVQ